MDPVSHYPAHLFPPQREPLGQRNHYLAQKKERSSASFGMPKGRFAGGESAIKDEIQREVMDNEKIVNLVLLQSLSREKSGSISEDPSESVISTNSKDFQEFIKETPAPESSRSLLESDEARKARQTLAQNKEWVGQLIELIERLDLKLKEQQEIIKLRGAGRPSSSASKYSKQIPQIVKEGYLILRDVADFEKHIVEFNRDPRNIQDIKSRSIAFAKSAEQLLSKCFTGSSPSQPPNPTPQNLSMKEPGQPFDYQSKRYHQSYSDPVSMSNPHPEWRPSERPNQRPNEPQMPEPRADFDQNRYLNEDLHSAKDRLQEIAEMYEAFKTEQADSQPYYMSSSNQRSQDIQERPPPSRGPQKLTKFRGSSKPSSVSRKDKQQPCLSDNEKKAFLLKEELKQMISSSQAQGISLERMLDSEEFTSFVSSSILNSKAGNKGPVKGGVGKTAPKTKTVKKKSLGKMASTPSILQQQQQRGFMKQPSPYEQHVSNAKASYDIRRSSGNSGSSIQQAQRSVYRNHPPVNRTADDFHKYPSISSVFTPSQDSLRLDDLRFSPYEHQQVNGRSFYPESSLSALQERKREFEKQCSSFEQITSTKLPTPSVQERPYSTVDYGGHRPIEVFETLSRQDNSWERLDELQNLGRGGSAATNIQSSCHDRSEQNPMLLQTFKQLALDLREEDSEFGSRREYDDYAQQETPLILEEGRADDEMSRITDQRVMDDYGMFSSSQKIHPTKFFSSQQASRNLESPRRLVPVQLGTESSLLSSGWRGSKVQLTRAKWN